MMTDEQVKIIRAVYQRFRTSDNQETGWSDIDESMSMLTWLEDGQLTIEASLKIIEHSEGRPKCAQNHPIEDCFVPTIVEAVGIILDLYAKTGNLHSNNRFVLQYYLALSQTGFIIY